MRLEGECFSGDDACGDVSIRLREDRHRKMAKQSMLGGDSIEFSQKEERMLNTISFF